MKNNTKIEKHKESNNRELTGVVAKLSGINTLKVRIESKFPHPKYGKIIKQHRNYLVNYISEKSEIKVGDLVRIRESKPFSKNKSWELVK